MSTSKITSIVIVVLIHLFIGYALITGLAYQAMKRVQQNLTTVDVKKDTPPPKKPPPPPKDVKPVSPPIVSPPPIVQTPSPPPPIQTVATPPPFVPQTPVVTPPAPPAPPPAPPPAVSKRPNPIPRGSLGDLFSQDDYPSVARRENKTGTTGFRLTVGPDGRVSDCEVTSSSGSSDLDQATCNLLRRRARFQPALDPSGSPTTGSYGGRFTWRLEDNG